MDSEPMGETFGSAAAGGARQLWLFTARDSLFFGAGLPFFAGETGRQKSRFPPSPLTMQGAVRAILLQAHHADVREFVRGWCTTCRRPAAECPVMQMVGEENDAETSAISLRGPLVATDDGELFYPAPLDLAWGRRRPSGVQAQADKPTKELVRLVPSEDATWTDMGLRRLPAAPEGYEDLSGVEGRYLAAHDFSQYLLGTVPKPGQLIDLWEVPEEAQTEGGAEQKHRVPPVADELHVGIGLNPKTRTAQEHMLYITHHVRLAKGYSLAEQVEPAFAGANGRQNGDGAGSHGQADVAQALPDVAGILADLVRHAPDVVRLGGESRLSFLQVRKCAGPTTDEKRQIANTLDSQNSRQGPLRFRLVLLQPARFRQGWLPDGLNPESLSGALRGVPVKLVSACLGKPVRQGGWDLANRRPKPTAAFVPAGSVYFFETTDPHCSGREIVEALHDEKLGLQTKAGFGHVMVGCGW
ncbi:MAG: hypothetical protein IMW99_08215 [Firmicutes bacterium]|nr:hypothetical protein [Bacillota bacterium]